MKRNFDQLYSDHWGILEVMITDRSPIDLKRLKLRDREDAQQFIMAYGYNLDDPDEAKELEKLRNEALNFIQEHFLKDLSPEYRPLSIPSTIQYADTQELLLLASGNPRSELQKWACATLRVMHTLSHVISDLAVHYFPDIQQQVLGPYKRHIHRDDKGQLWLGKDQELRLKLVDFEVKAGKERDSAVLKLLHKRENVASDIFDRIGVRFVTRDRLDSVLVMCYLREHHLVSFPNLKPSRSINTLIHIDKFRKSFKSHYEQYKNGELSETELEDYLRKSAQFDDLLSNRQIQHLFNRNPYTSSKYRAIQFTVRQLVRIVNPLHAYKCQVNELEDTPVLRERFYSARPHYRFYFPYEVQIVDIETHKNNTSGQASHEEYKRRQLLAARRRVLDRLLKKAETPRHLKARSHFDMQTRSVNIAHEYPGQTPSRNRNNTMPTKSSGTGPLNSSKTESEPA